MYLLTIELACVFKHSDEQAAQARQERTPLAAES